VVRDENRFESGIASLALSIGLISSLKRAEEVNIPSLPFASTTTGSQVTAIPGNVPEIFDGR
jgi:hypothetical protein